MQIKESRVAIYYLATVKKGYYSREYGRRITDGFPYAMDWFINHESIAFTDIGSGCAGQHFSGSDTDTGNVTIVYSQNYYSSHCASGFRILDAENTC